jgi:hypothetical protein
MPSTEATFLERGGLTQLRCLQWLHIAKQFYARPWVKLSDPLPSKNLPPISFLNLLIDWIDAYAKITGRQRSKSRTWRWRALQGFVKRNRRLQTRKFLLEISLLATSIAAHFSKPPFDHPLFVLWGDWHRFHKSQDSRRYSSASGGPGGIERGRQAAKVFDVLERVANNGKVLAGDYSTLTPYLSKEFPKPFLIEALHDQRERKLFAELIARAAAMEVYLQHLKLMRTIEPHRDYVRKVTTWSLKLGEPEAQPQFNVVHWRFCARSPVESATAAKKPYSVLTPCSFASAMNTCGGAEG